MEQIAAGAIAALAFEKFFGKTAEKLAEGTIARMDELRARIGRRRRGNPKAAAALQEAESGSKAALAKVESYLQSEMLEEPGFAQEMRSLAQEIRAQKQQDNSAMGQVNRDRATGVQMRTESGGTTNINITNDYRDRQH